MGLKNIVIATEKKGYYKVLEESCKRHNIELIPLGMGEEWNGFTKKFYLWNDYLKDLNDDEIVMINDAYDVIILENSEKIIKKFKSFNKNIVLSYQNSKLLNLIFTKCDLYKNVLCSGNIIGYVKYLKELINLIKKHDNIWEENGNDDQLILQSICEIEKDFFKRNIIIDKDQEIFFVTTGEDYFKNFFLKKVSNLDMKNNKLYTKKNITPSILHLAGNLDGIRYLKYLNYKNIPKKNLIKISKYKVKQLSIFLKTLLLKKGFYLFLCILYILIYLHYFKLNKESLIKFILGYVIIFQKNGLVLILVISLSIIIFVSNLI